MTMLAKHGNTDRKNLEEKVKRRRGDKRGEGSQEAREITLWPVLVSNIHAGTEVSITQGIFGGGVFRVKR